MSMAILSKVIYVQKVVFTVEQMKIVDLCQDYQ